MLQKLQQFWTYISYIGVGQEDGVNTLNRKKEIFFNRAIFIGFFGSFGTMFNVIPFIGDDAYWSLFMHLSIILGVIVHAYGHFGLAKRIVFYGVMLVGPDVLFHFGVINVCAFGLIIFDFKKDKFDLIVCVLLTIGNLLVGELRIGNPPDLTAHPDIESARLGMLINMILLITIFIMFIIRMNTKNEIGLSDFLDEKEQLIKNINTKTLALEKNNVELEDTIKVRTEKIQEQNSVLEKQNEEKEMLLKEVHHRVKNNLQIIISLINLEISKFESEKVENALIETQNRVMSMSLVHKKMYQSSNFTEIFLLDYCSQLMENIKHLGESKTYTSSIEIEESIYLDVEKAIPFGLIINEIMTNFFKYADSLVNDLHLVISSDESVQLTCKDNGDGFPESVLQRNSDSLGIELIESLAEQLDGEFKISNNNGAVYELQFKL